MGVNVLLIGESKSGKTRALETLPRGLVVFSFDKGGWHTFVRKKVGEGRWLSGKGRPVQVVSNFRDWWATEESLGENGILAVDYAISDPILPQQYTRTESLLITNFIVDANMLWDIQGTEKRGVCHTAIDSLTSLQRPVMEFILALNMRNYEIFQDWRQAINKIDEIVQSFVGLPIDFVLTCHIQAEKDELTGKVKEQPLIYGKQLPNLLLAKFDDIFLTTWEMTPAGGRYLWGTAPEGLLKTVGTRDFDNLPMRVEPNFEKLYGELLYQRKEVIKSE